MVSPSVSTPAPVPPLSYADRAKKAQNIRSPNSVPPPQTLAQAVPPPPSGSDASTASSSTALSNSSPPKSSSSVDVTPSSSIILTTRPSSPSPHTTDAPDIKPMNGDLRATKDLTPKSPSTTTTHASPQKLPVVNVWSLRKEQMAARTPSHPAIPPSTQTTPQVSKPPVVSQNPTTSRAPPSRPHSDALPNGPHGLAPIKPNNNVKSPVPIDTDDPFVVRLPAQISRAPRLPLPTPAVDDTESWPEVGKSLLPTAMPSLSNNSAVDPLPGLRDEGGSTKRPETVQPVAATPRKSEKTKWVPIPPEELQAASDAVRASSRQSHSRNQSQHANPLPKPPRNHTQGSGSGSGSGSAQGQSRNHSGRNSTAQSVSQSRVQSRAGSLHSSPRLPRGRRLPGDDGPVTGTSGHGGVTTPAVSTPPSTSSPQPQLYIDTGRASSLTHPTPAYGPMPAQVGNIHMTYYQQQPSHLPPTIPQNQNQQHSQHYRQSSSHSPLGAPYGLPGPGPSANEYQSPVPPQPSQGHPGGHSPYPLYPPYGQIEFSHGPTQPYVYWNGLPGSGHHSPSYPPPHGSHVPPPHHRQQHEDIERAEGEVPPPTMIVRPPPPGESQAVAAYRAVEHIKHAGEGFAFKTAERPVVFGSIGIPGASKCPSPVPPNSSGGGDCMEKVEVSEKGFTAFSIGVAPGEGGPSRLRSRTRSSTAQSKTETENGRHMSDLTNGEIREVVREVKKKGLGRDATGATNGDMKVVDLTDTETKWEFGTTGHLEADEEPVPPREPAPQQPSNAIVSPQAAHGHQVPMGRTIRSDSPILPVENLVPLSMPLTAPMGVQLASPPISSPFPIQGLRPALFTAEASGKGDEWEVKDFGFGFGHASGSGYAPAITREERLARDRERERQKEQERAERALERQMEREREKELERERLLEREMEKERERERIREIEFSMRPRRGSHSAGYGGYERGGYERGGYERGYGGRRGRGNVGYTGRGFNRNSNRGPYQPPQQQRQTPFSITPPPQFQPLVPLNDPSNGFYPPQQRLTTYIPSGFESYQPPPPPAPAPAPPPAPPQLNPPLPVPLSSLSFPLDPVRWHLLGQLEYYLSPQNMAQDFFLRQKMDSHGWIPISLIASFNRVRQLTRDAQLVRNVLILSTLVQVKDDWVRMDGWEQFVLPDAPRSTVEGIIHEQFETQSLHYTEEKEAVYIRAEGEVEDGEGDGECEAEEDEEEDVVFVMGREAGSWSPERHT